MADWAKEVNLVLAKEAFRRLGKRAKNLEVNGQDLKKIKSLNSLKTRNYRRLFVIFISVFLLPSLAYIGFGALNEETRNNFTGYLANYVLNVDLERDHCLVPVHFMYVELFRPPVDCSMCEDLDSVDVVTNLTKSEFVEKYAYTGRPVLIRNGTKDWRALSHFSFDFFKKIYPKDSPVLQSDNVYCLFFPYRSKFETLGEVFDMPDSMAKMQGEPWYIGWSNCDSGAANVLRKYYQKPYFLPDESESSKTDWIFMGCPGYGANLHIDFVGKPSWQGQIKGTKQWILEAPPECYFKCKTQKHVVVVQPGDISSTKEPWSKQKMHKKVLDKGKPDDVMPGNKTKKEPLPPQPITGMLNKASGKVRLTFKLELDQVWIGTKERTEKVSMGSIKNVLSEPIDGNEDYHVLAIQLGPTEASRYWVYWVPAQYVDAIKDTILGKWQPF